MNGPSQMKIHGGEESAPVVAPADAMPAMPATPVVASTMPADAMKKMGGAHALAFSELKGGNQNNSKRRRHNNSKRRSHNNSKRRGGNNNNKSKHNNSKRRGGNNSKRRGQHGGK